MLEAARVVWQIEPEFDGQSVANLAQLNVLDLSLRLGCSGVLESVQFPEHLHVKHELVLGSFNNNFLLLVNDLVLEGHAHFLVSLVDFVTLGLVLQIGLVAQLVVLNVELDPFASLAGCSHNATIELSLALAEDLDVGSLIFSFENF